MKLFQPKISKIITVDLAELKIGLIIKMAPGYHTKNPYYAEITFFNGEAKNGELIMITSIPGEHSLSMIVGSNWEYHNKRITIIGPKSSHSHLLYNQKLD